MSSHNEPESKVASQTQVYDTADLTANIQNIQSTKPEAETRATPPDAPAAAAAATSQGQILVLAQDPDLVPTLVSQMGPQGVQCLFFGSEEELLAARTTVTNPTMLVLDAGDAFLPTFALYRQLRQSVAFSEVPVLFLIEANQANEALDACNLRNNDYIVKPMEQAALALKYKRMQQSKSEPLSEEGLSIGELIARRFEVIRFVGEGGMGKVYLVRDLQSDQKVALKLIANLGDSDESKNNKRFQKEIEALLTLNHPNVIKIHNYGHHRNFSYYTMDYLPYGCLADVIEEKGALAYPQALQIFIPLASALFHAHQHGILHRDLKPENIMFKQGGAPVLTDFGLALQIEKKQTRLTKKGHIIGTAYYMSPEQITSPHQLDARSDIYSLGALLFELLTGTPPFKGDNPFEVLRQVLTQPTPLAKDRYDAIPQAVSDFCRQAMDRDKEKRFPSAAAMVQVAAMLLTQK